MEEDKVVSTEVVAETPVVEVSVEATAAVAEVSAPVTEAAEEPSFTLPPPRKKTAEERINEMRRKQGDAERLAEYWKRVALEKEQAKPQEPVQVAPTPEQLPPEPKEEQFTTYADYIKALVRHERMAVDAEAQARVAKQNQLEAQRQYEKSVANFFAKAEPVRQQYEDFDEVIKAEVFTSAMESILFKTDNGPEVAYFLCRPENRALANKINSLPLVDQIYELGKLETSLLVAKKTRKVPAAPTPITPVGGITGGAEVDESKMSTEEVIKHWDKKRLEALQKKFGG